MGYRKQPFGYRMEKGQIIIHDREAEVIQTIFREYTAGIGFAALAERLNTRGVKYDTDKPWNKNMIARVLQDSRYIGDKTYPAIVSASMMAAAEEIRRGKCLPCAVSPTQKVLRRLCGSKPPKSVEVLLLKTINRLIEDPALIQCQNAADTSTQELQAVKERLDTLLDAPPVDVETAKPLILRLAALRYDQIGDSEYETMRLRALFGGRQPQSELDADLLQEAISSVSTKRGGKIIITLKNGQTLEGGTAE